jgi:hypothetical protein
MDGSGVSLRIVTDHEAAACAWGNEFVRGTSASDFSKPPKEFSRLF